MWGFAIRTARGEGAFSGPSGPLSAADGISRESLMQALTFDLRISPCASECCRAL
jgi:hypothetical protein